MHMRIGGRDVAGADDRWMPVMNPATGEEIDRVPEGTLYEVDDAVRAAEDAFPAWASRTARERGSILLRGASLVRERYGEISRLLTLEQGKPLRESADEIRGFANVLEYYAGIAGLFPGEYIPLGPAGDAIVTREPLGVCGAIIPWNMPALLMAWKTSPALLAGNTLVLKPASRTPLTACVLARTLEEAGLPPGVLNVVTGKGEVVGEGIVRHPRISRVSFTGNVETGLRVQELAAGSFKDVTLELGGSDPMIVWKDADIGNAVAGAVRGRFYNAGQTCTAVKRLFVHENISAEFLQRLRKRVEGLRVGNGLDEGIDMGPLCGPGQRDEINRFMEDFKRKGEGTILAGGEPLRGPAYDRGSFFAPTVVKDVHPESALLRKEVFGPILPVMCFDDLDTAIRHANETRYGLGASIWTRDISVAREVFARVNAGVVWVNRHLTIPPEIPFGGVRASGLGRENGSQALLSYTRTKTLYIGR
ncbi:MAG TPA: aldehyde dehydrogenase family protein [Methanolinea sp.]|jgi:succinate-semialdehyde dehydrogenase/glutarate-semialdehyde dehydrogenase|nr:aldehyde dehydrogenase family protein [Methanolinea sp.]HQJ18657.1 aldehyde dehydrogenase family protein [Methanolinea sp.]